MHFAVESERCGTSRIVLIEWRGFALASERSTGEEGSFIAAELLRAEGLRFQAWRNAARKRQRAGREAEHERSEEQQTQRVAAF